MALEVIVDCETGGVTEVDATPITLSPVPDRHAELVAAGFTSAQADAIMAVLGTG